MKTAWRNAFNSLIAFDYSFDCYSADAKQTKDFAIRIEPAMESVSRTRLKAEYDAI